MITRRKFLVASTAIAAAGSPGTRFGAARSASTNLPLQNASFISSAGDATPEASPVASPAALADSEDFRGYIFGDPDAPNTLQLYADYRCPHCRTFSADIMPQLIQDYLEPGRLNVEYIDFTVIGVPSFEDLVDDSIESVQAAEAAACAAEQDSYLAYRDWLFDGPSRTSEGDFSDENLISAAETLGLDVDLFTESLGTGKYEKAIIDSVSMSLERGVQGTPAMILNGGAVFYTPATGYDGLKTLLESELQ